MSGIIFLFALLILLACYGFYTLSHLLLRRFFPYKPNVTLYVSLSIAFCFFAASAFGAASALTQIRSQAFTQGLAEAAAQPSADSSTADEVRNYSEAYTKGYTDAIDEYIDRILASALGNIPQPDADAESKDPADGPKEDPDVSNGPQEDPGTQGSADDSGNDTPAPQTGTTVYYTKSGSVLHRSRSCSYLKNASEILSCDASEAPNRPYCSRCG